jgi:hypothetical protein
MKRNTTFIAILLLSMPTVTKAMLKKPIGQLSIIKSFLSNPRSLATLKKVMDEIEDEKLGYDDYSKRTGLIWSDVSVETAPPAKMVAEYETEKVTQVLGALKAHKPQSIFKHPTAASIVFHEILPKMFETMRSWTDLPATVFAQIFFQRCSTSEPMNWHQDPGEDFEPQADYTMVLYLSDQNDPEHGWNGGKFKIRSGLPEDTYDETDVQTIIPCYNQAIIFNNQLNSHAVTEVTSTMSDKTKRDIIVVPINLTKLPIKKMVN